MRIEERLKTYKQDKARMKVLEIKLSELQKYLNNPVDLRSEIIEGLGLSAAPIDEKPGRVSARPIGRPVERITIEVEQEDMRIDALKSEIASSIVTIQEELDRLRIGIEPVEAALEGLSDRERFVIEQFFIEKLTWYVVRSRFEQRYNMPCSNATLKRDKRSALGKIRKILT